VSQKNLCDKAHTHAQDQKNYGRTIRNVRFVQGVYHTCKKYINIFINLKS